MILSVSLKHSLCGNANTSCAFALLSSASFVIISRARSESCGNMMGNDPKPPWRLVDRASSWTLQTTCISSHLHSTNAVSTARIQRAARTVHRVSCSVCDRNLTVEDGQIFVCSAAQYLQLWLLWYLHAWCGESFQNKSTTSLQNNTSFWPQTHGKENVQSYWYQQEVTLSWKHPSVSPAFSGPATDRLHGPTNFLLCPPFVTRT